MKTFFSEYGRFLVAIIAGSFVFYFALKLRADFKTYSSNYIEAITGVDDASYKVGDDGG